MKNLKIKKLIGIVMMLIIVFLIIGVLLYFNKREEITIVSKDINEPYTVTLGEDNCIIERENYTARIKKYNGNADTVVINKDMVSSPNIEINYDAFSECTNLETILIKKTIINQDFEIEDFKRNYEYEDEEYIAYTTTKQYSEAYQQYLELSEEEKSRVELIPNKYNVSISALYSESMEENYQVSTLASQEIAESFDLRDKIDIKVEDQASTGICYAFASLTSVETNLALIHNENVDLSEVHLASLTTGYGGNFITDTNSYYADEVGPVYESEWPIENLWVTNKDNNTTAIYNYLTRNTSSLSSSVKQVLKETIAKKKVTETVNFPSIIKGSNLYDNDDIEAVRKTVKKHIMQYGSIFAGISSSGITYNSNNGLYVAKATSSNTVDHAVSIVGWDDDFSKENFPTGYQPNSDGAYLALNSWGDNWGDGYFWISYEDYWVETNLCGVISVEDILNISLDSVTIKNLESEEEILSNKIVKGSNVEVGINISTNSLIDNQNEFEISVISPEGEEITNQIEIEGNSIKNNQAQILITVDTSNLEIGEYIINLTYGEELISTTIEITNSNIEGTGWYYVTDKYKLYILENNTDKTYEYLKDYIYTVEIQDSTITSLFAHQFEGYENLKEVILPDTITELKISTFYGCSNLKTVQMLAEVVEIGEGAFYGCTNLENVITNKGISNVGNYAFAMCSKLQAINIVSGALGKSAFYGCTNLKIVNMQEGVTSIGEGAFYQCINLQSLYIPNGVTIISDYAFSYCTNLQNINMQEGITSIGYGAFYECINLQSLNIPKGITALGDYSFNGCTGLETINAQDGLISIGYAAFEYCSNLKTVKLGEDLKSIGNYAFSYCTNLQNINLPEGITSIGYGAFSFCENLINFEIPENATIGNFVCYQSTIHIKIENGTILFEELQNIIQRTMTETDTLYCSGNIAISNAAFNEDNSQLIIVKDAENVTMSISSGKLNGLTIVAEVLYRTIEYSETEWTDHDVTATFNMAEGDVITNNEALNTYTFLENGEFSLEFTNVNGFQKTLTAKVDNIDKDAPDIIIEGNPTICTTDPVTLKVSATDSGIGLAELAYSFNGGETWGVEETKTYEENTNGINIQVRDALGNIAKETIDITRIGHDMTEATCTEEGKCKIDGCNHTEEAKGHTEVIDEAIEETCTTDGKTEGKHCSECDEVLVEQQIIPASGHTEVIDAAIEETCTTDGKTEGKHCSECDEVLIEQQTIPATGHTEVIDEAVKETCTTDGKTEGKHCSECDEVLVEQQTIPASGHTEVIDTAIEETCTTEGKTEGKHCSECDEVLVAQETIPATGHTEVIDEAVKETCTTDGKTEGKHCSECEEVLIEQQTIPATGHTEVIDEAVKETCTTEGKTEGKHCSECDEVLVEQQTIPASGHTEVIDEAVEETCTTEGKTEGKHCSECNEVLVAQEKIPAIGHNYKNRICTICGKKELRVDIKSQIYNIEDMYIYKVEHLTTIEEFKNQFETNAEEIKVYDKDGEEADKQTVVTGMKIEFKLEEKIKAFTIVVGGDVNGDGKADFKDMIAINKHRLKKKALEGEYKLAGDVNGDNGVDFKDMIKINKFRLKKITQLFEIL